MEEFSVKVEPASDPQQDPAEEDLFHDMTPVFQKPKKVRIEYIIKLSCGTLQNCSKKVALFSFAYRLFSRRIKVTLMVVIIHAQRLHQVVLTLI